MNRDEALDVDHIKQVLLERSLFSIFLNESEIEEYLEKYPVEFATENRVLFTEGQTARDLFVPVSGEIHLSTKTLDGKSAPAGTVSQGRSAGLYSVVRGLPFQYSGIAGENCAFVRVPWDALVPKILQVKGLENYLQLITESPIIRALAKEIDEIGCCQQFRVQLLGSLKPVNFFPQQWLAQEDETVRMAWIVTEGEVVVYKKAKDGSNKTLWQVPARSWQLWTEANLNRVSSYSFRSLTSGKRLQISADELNRLHSVFPNDFEKYEKWIHGATSAQKISKDNQEGEGEEIESLSELFKDKVSPRRNWRLSYPFVRQNDQMDCGPACLSMISKYFGNDIPIQFWREKVGTGAEGTSLFDLARGAEQMGFITHGIGVDTLDDIESETLPIIALRKYHYVVVYRIEKKFVIVGDPGVGIRKMSRQEFLDGFQQAVLLLKPTEGFFHVDVPKAPFAHYFELMSGYRSELILVLMCSVVIVVLSMFPPVLSQIIMDEVLAKKDVHMLLAAIGGASLIAVLSSGMTWIRSYYLSFLAAKFDFRAHSVFVRKLFSLPYSYFTARHVGDFTRRLAEMERIREFAVQTVIGTLLDLCTLVFYALVLFSYSSTVGVLAFVTAPILVGISMLFSKKLVGAYGETFTSRSEQESLIGDLIKGVGTIKALGGEVASRWRFEERVVKTLQTGYKFNILASALRAISDGYEQVTRFILMGAAAYIGIKGQLSPGQVIALSMLVGHVVGPFYSLAQAWSGIQEMRSVLERLNDVFLAHSESSGQKRGVKKAVLRGEIEFKDVWFRYGGESSDWVLKGLTFKIEAGQNVAIVGPSGSGKSTIAYLLNRMLEPTKGQILIDGRDHRDYDLDWLRSQIGLLLQEPQLFYGKIAENICFGTPEIDHQRMENAAIMADAHQFIMKKSLGFAYTIQHGGLGLSGGEKQRIALARTLFTRPAVLVLDEATSALDGLSERALLDQLRSETKGKTVLSIAHRYSTVRMSDFALVIRDGITVGFGTHEQLASEAGLYSELFGLTHEERSAA